MGLVGNISGQPAAVAPGGRFLYVCRSNVVQAFRVDPQTGALAAVPGQPFLAAPTGVTAVTAAVDATGRFIYVATGQNIAVFTLDANLGSLTPAGMPAAIDEVNALAAQPTAPYLFSAAGSTLYVSSIDPVSGALSAIHTVTIPQITALVPSPDGKLLYVHTALPGQNTTSVFVFDFDAASGGLAEVAGSPFRLRGTTAAAITLDPSQRFLYALNGSSPAGNVVGFLLNAATGGVLTTVPGSPYAAGNTPSFSAADQSGRFLYVGDLNNGAIQEYSIDGLSGSLAPLVGSPIPGGAWQLFAVTPSSAISPALVSLSVTPSSASVTSSGFGKTVQFTAVGQYNDGSTRFLTASAVWSSSNNGVAKISSNPKSAGLATTVNNGSASITATIGSLTANASLTVNQPSLRSLSVTPANGTIGVGTAIQFKAIGTYSDGTRQNLAGVARWNSSSTAVATVNASGEATALASGSTTIFATVGSVSGSTLLTVR